MIKHCHDLASILTCDSSTVFNVRHVPVNVVGSLLKLLFNFMRFEIRMMINIKIAVFWVMMLCGLVGGY